MSYNDQKSKRLDSILNQGNNEYESDFGIDQNQVIVVDDKEEKVDQISIESQFGIIRSNNFDIDNSSDDLNDLKQNHINNKDLNELIDEIEFDEVENLSQKSEEPTKIEKENTVKFPIENHQKKIVLNLKK